MPPFPSLNWTEPGMPTNLRCIQAAVDTELGLSGEDTHRLFATVLHSFRERIAPQAEPRGVDDRRRMCKFLPGGERPEPMPIAPSPQAVSGDIRARRGAPLCWTAETVVEELAACLDLTTDASGSEATHPPVAGAVL